MARSACSLIGLLVAILLGVVGCGDDITINPDAQWASGIQVAGTGSAFGEPDVAILRAGVSVEERTVDEARALAAEAMQGMIDSAKQNGVADEDIQTQYFNIQPQYNYNDGRQELRGYRVTNSVSIKIRNMNTVGQVIDDIAAAGGDSTLINSIQFTIDDPTVLQAEARVAAMNDAEAKAMVLAEEGGVTLGKPMSIAESFGSNPPTYYYDDNRAEAGFDVQTPIESGELEIKVTVSVVYEID